MNIKKLFSKKRQVSKKSPNKKEEYVRDAREAIENIDRVDGYLIWVIGDKTKEGARVHQSINAGGHDLIRLVQQSIKETPAIADLYITALLVDTAGKSKEEQLEDFLKNFKGVKN